MSFKMKKENKSMTGIIIFAFIVLVITCIIGKSVEYSAQDRVASIESMEDEIENYKVQFYKTIYKDHPEIKNNIDVAQFDKIFQGKDLYDEFVQHLNSKDVLLTKNEYEFYKKVYKHYLRAISNIKSNIDTEKLEFLSELENGWIYNLFLTEKNKKDFNIGYNGS